MRHPDPTWPRSPDGLTGPAEAELRPGIVRQFELTERVQAYDPKADTDLIDAAYVVAMQAHGPQRRENGDPYITHPVAVADILAGYRLDVASIATGLLHDVIEDTPVTLPEIERRFGGEIAGLVDGVTKLTRLELQSDRTKQAENFRKLVLAMSKDIRVLLVKLADRLHNMRTLHFVAAPERRARIARETMEIYAPLAERIGMESGEVRAADALLRAARAGSVRRRSRPGSTSCAARAPTSSRRCGKSSCASAASPASRWSRSPGGRNRPTRSGRRCSGATSPSSSSPTSWRSASSCRRARPATWRSARCMRPSR